MKPKKNSESVPKHFPIRISKDVNPRIADRNGKIQALWIVVLVLIFSNPVWGYEEIPVKSGGTISGKIFLHGSPPPARIFQLVLSPNMDFCGRVSDGKGNRLFREFRVSSDGGFADVVVALIGVERGKPFDFAPTLVFEDCQVSPFVTAIRHDHSIEMINKDPIPHDFQAYSLKGSYTFGMFNRRIAPESAIYNKVDLRKNHFLFRAQCGIHAYMQSWGMAVGNPYFAVSSEKGEFEISEIPPGTYHVVAWHPFMEVQAREVIVHPEGKIWISFRFDSKEVQIPLHDLQTGYRFDTVLQPDQVVNPLELQHP